MAGSFLPADLDLLESPLPLLFESAEKIYNNAESMNALAPETRTRFHACIELLKQCRRRVESLGVFSSNEELDDIPTQNIKYLLINFMAGDIASRTPEREPRPRLAELAQAVGFLRAFLAQLDRLGLASQEVRAFLEREEGARPDPGRAREDKISRFKRERELRQRISEIESKIAAAAGGTVRRGGGGAVSDTEDSPGETSVSGGETSARTDADFLGRLVGGGGGGGGKRGGRVVEEGEEGLEGAGVEEGVIRQLYLARLDMASIKAVDMIAMLSHELEIVKYAASQAAANGGRPGQAGQANNGANGGAGPPRDFSIMRQLAEAAGRLNDRERIRQQVLRPGHNLPTMTLQELADQEMAEAREREARQGRAEEGQRERKAKYQETGDDDELLRKDRAWDDFKDDNPTGWGNSAIKPLR